MAKRYHESMRGDYEGREGRRRQEMMDGMMIKEDHSKIANLPQEVMIKDWPKTRAYLGEGLDDTIRGIDRQMDSLDGAKAKSHEEPKKV